MMYFLAMKTASENLSKFDTRLNSVDWMGANDKRSYYYDPVLLAASHAFRHDAIRFRYMFEL